jgi:hypothetical protein
MTFVNGTNSEARRGVDEIRLRAHASSLEKAPGDIAN